MTTSQSYNNNNQNQIEIRFKFMMHVLSIIANDSFCVRQNVRLRVSPYRDSSFAAIFAAELPTAKTVKP